MTNTGDRTPTVMPSSTGSITALVSEPSDTNPLDSSTTAKMTSVSSV